MIQDEEDGGIADIAGSTGTDDDNDALHSAANTPGKLPKCNEWPNLIVGVVVVAWRALLVMIASKMADQIDLDKWNLQKRCEDIYAHKNVL